MTLDVLLGTDRVGREVRIDLCTMPHLLVAGTTGSGKSVWINSMMLDLVALPPERVRFLLIDPKRVELAMYGGLPHVVYGQAIWDMSVAARALDWVATQMEQRFALLAATYARNDAGQDWPKIVIVIDELANLLLTNPDAERPIIRLASMSRAVGIHLVMATQRPDATVLSGLLRGNVPARIAFATMTAAESRIILDETGAERLAGKGEMLVRLPGNRTLLNLQGRYVSDEQIEAGIRNAIEAAV